MARKFTKYPHGYVRATTDSSAKLIGYGIDYRNMHNAIHGIIWSPDKDVISVVESICSELENPESEESYNDYLGDFDDIYTKDDVHIIEEINFRDITSDRKYYDDYLGGYIQIINPVAFDLYDM